MRILHDCDIIEYLKGSIYYKTFSKIVDGERVILVPPEFIISNDELQSINTYEEFFNIIEKFNFWMIEFYPKEIYN